MIVPGPARVGPQNVFNSRLITHTPRWTAQRMGYDSEAYMRGYGYEKWFLVQDDNSVDPKIKGGYELWEVWVTSKRESTSRLCNLKDTVPHIDIVWPPGYAIKIKIQTSIFLDLLEQSCKIFYETCPCNFLGGTWKRALGIFNNELISETNCWEAIRAPHTTNMPRSCKWYIWLGLGGQVST